MHYVSTNVFQELQIIAESLLPSPFSADVNNTCKFISTAGY
jgi:hypothetical protein